MNKERPQQHPSQAVTVFRPPFWFLCFWILPCAGMLFFAIRVAGVIFEFPAWAKAFFVLFASLGLINCLVLAFASVRVEPTRLVSRHFIKWSVLWENVEGWSQLGHHGDVFLRLRDGTIHGVSSWCVYGARSDQLAALLASRLGPPQTGDHEIQPKWLSWIRSVMQS